MKGFRNGMRALLVSTAVLLAACGGGGSGASTASKATVTTGEVAGFGSVIVNGVKFSRKTGLADDKVKLGFENQNVAEDKLRLGMVVTIKGSVNSTTGTGEYESIEFHPELRGPLDDNGVDLVNDRITIMGRQVQVGPGTHFDSIRDLAEINSEMLAGRNPELEISGTMDSTGVVRATRIGRKADDFTAGAVELKGAIAASPAPTTNGFTIGTRAVVVNDATVFANMTRSAIAAGAFVEVKGTLSGGVLTATRVEKKAAVAGAQAEDDVRVKGSVAAGSISSTGFTVNGPNGPITVTTSSSTVFMQGNATATSAIVTPGAILEVEGSLTSAGAIAAIKVKLEVEKNFKVEGNAAAGAFNATVQTITLNGVTVGIAPTTRLLDANGSALSLATIAAGDHLQIAGIADGTGSVTASQIHRTTASAVSFVEGPVTAETATTLTILGITVDTATVTQAHHFVDSRTGTEVPGTGTVNEARNAFFLLVTPGTSIVKAKGAVTATVLSATEVELEQ